MDEFTKFDSGDSLNLEDIFRELGEAMKEEGFFDGLTSGLAALADDYNPTELSGYYAYKLLWNDRYYFPRKGTLRHLTSGWTIFVDALASEYKPHPVYVSIPSKDLGPITWLPEEPEEVNEDYGLMVA